MHARLELDEIINSLRLRPSAARFARISTWLRVSLSTLGNWSTVNRVHFRYIKIHTCFRHAWGNEIKEMYYSSLSLKMISFVLFPHALQPSMNFNISEFVYCWSHIPPQIGRGTITRLISRQRSTMSMKGFIFILPTLLVFTEGKALFCKG